MKGSNFLQNLCRLKLHVISSINLILYFVVIKFHLNGGFSRLKIKILLHFCTVALLLSLW